MTLLTQQTKPKTISLISVLVLLVFLPLMLLAVQNIAVLITCATEHQQISSLIQHRY
jgi:hypothetical protein